MEEYANKKKIQKKNLPICPLHGPGHDMNSCKVMLAQSKGMKSNWLTAHGVSTGFVRFQGAKKRLAEGKDLNYLVANAVKSVINPNKRKRAKASSDSSSEYKKEHYNSETLNIGGE